MLCQYNSYITAISRSSSTKYHSLTPEENTLVGDEPQPPQRQLEIEEESQTEEFQKDAKQAALLEEEEVVPGSA